MLLRDWPRSHQAAVAALLVVQLPRAVSIGTTGPRLVGSLVATVLLSVVLVAVARVAASGTRKLKNTLLT